MASTILSGDLTVYYLDEDRRKQIKWTGGTTKSDTQIMIDIYDACEDLMTIPAQSNDGLIWDAPTPGEYIIGKIDAGELDPWFIDIRTVEKIIGDNGNFTGCAIRSQGWERDLPGDGTGNCGIVVVPVNTGHDIDDTDIGDTITHGTDGDTGTLLDWYDDGTDGYLWIRPTSNALANDWNSTSGACNMDSSAHTATQNAAAHTGEMIWGNVFTSGAIVPKTHIYMIQDGTKIIAFNDTGAAIAEDWWPDGHLDRAVPITDWTTSAFPLIDSGVLTVKAGQYGTKYFPIVISMNTTSGGNVSAGLTSGNDATNNTGYASIVVDTVTTDDFSVGDEIVGQTSGARAIITQIDGTSPNYTFHYYLIGDPLTDFQTAIEGVDGVSPSTGESDKTNAAPADQGPALTTWYDGNTLPTIVYANNQVDVDDDSTDEEYAISIDVQQASLAQLTEFLKYIARRGSTTQIDAIDGEQWIGIDYAIFYSAFTATIAEGDVATGATSGATGTVVSFPGGTNSVMLLRNTRGSFTDSEVINFTSGGNMSAAQVTSVEVIVPVAENSFGTLAGTTFFASRGVVLTNYKTAETNLWSTISGEGDVKARPTSITVSMLNLLQYDWATWYRLTGAGGSIDKSEYTAKGGEAVLGTTIETNEATIAADVPNKDNGGRLSLRDDSDNGTEYVLRFSSFVPATGVVTLASKTLTPIATTNTTQITSTGSFASGVEVGDLVYNDDQSTASYVSEIVSDDVINIFPAIASQSDTDDIRINVLPIAPQAATDDIAFHIMHQFMEASGDNQVSMVYVADIYSLARLRNTSDATTKIKGQSQAVTIGTTGGSASLARIPNTVYGS